jgi:hypothetical protein
VDLIFLLAVPVEVVVALGNSYTRGSSSSVAAVSA